MITTELPRTYVNRRRAGMTDRQLVPEIQAIVEDLFLRWTGPEFPNMVILPDHSVVGSSLMIAITIAHEGDLRTKRGDPKHFDPVYTGSACREIASRLRATRLVLVAECWTAPDDGTDLPARLHPNRSDILSAFVLHKGETQPLGIRWEIATNSTARTLGIPEVGPFEFTNPDMVL